MRDSPLSLLSPWLNVYTTLIIFFFSFNSSPDGLSVNVLRRRPFVPMHCPHGRHCRSSSVVAPWRAAATLLPLLSRGRRPGGWPPKQQQLSTGRVAVGAAGGGGPRSHPRRSRPSRRSPPLLSSAQPRAEATWVIAGAAGGGGSREHRRSTMGVVLLCYRGPLRKKTQRRKKKAIWSFH